MVRVDVLSQSLGVSPVTIRRDLEHLQRIGLLHRTHGGAVHTRAFGPEPLYTDKRLECAAEKQRIARLAASILRSGQTVMLNGGTTTLAVAHAIAERTDLQRVRLVTVNVPVALEVEHEQIEVVLLGGVYRPQASSLVGTLTLSALSHIVADVAIVGADGIDPRFGATYPHQLEAGVVAAMLERCHGEVVLAADHRKLGVAAGNVGIAPERMTRVITDAAADVHAVQDLRRRGVEVLLA